MGGGGWVNMGEGTGTSHLADPFDPPPVEQGIGVYYTELIRGGVSFALLEDRKWKSAPKQFLPNARIVNGWARNPEYNPPRDGDVPGTQLLGARQQGVLEHWSQVWRGGASIKQGVSQRLVSTAPTLA